MSNSLIEYQNTIKLAKFEQIMSITVALLFDAYKQDVPAELINQVMPMSKQYISQMLTEKRERCILHVDRIEHILNG